MTDPKASADGDARPERKQRVFTEEAKQQQVSHWDWDYLPTAEIEKQMSDGQRDPRHGDGQSTVEPGT